MAILDYGSLQKELRKKSKKYIGKLKLRAAIMDFKETTLL